MPGLHTQSNRPARKVKSMGNTFSLGWPSTPAASSNFVGITEAGGISVSAELETGVTLPMHYEIVDTAPPYFGKSRFKLRVVWSSHLLSSHSLPFSTD